MTPSLVGTSLHWQAVSLLCCHTSPPQAFSLSPPGGLSLSFPHPSPHFLGRKSLSSLRHPSIGGLLHGHGAAATPFPRRTGTPLTGTFPSALPFRDPPFPPPFVLVDTPLPGAGRDWPPGSRALRRPPPPWEQFFPARRDRLGHVRRARSVTCGQSWPCGKPLPGSGPASQGQCSLLGGPMPGVSWAGASRKAAFVRKFLWVQLHIENCPERHRVWTALGPPLSACSPRGLRVVSFGLVFVP